MNIAKFLRTAFFIEHFRRLLLPLPLLFEITTEKTVRLITVNKNNVHSTSEKHLQKVLGMLQVVTTETQSLLLTFSISHVLF